MGELSSLLLISPEQQHLTQPSAWLPLILQCQCIGIHPPAQYSFSDLLDADSDILFPLSETLATVHPYDVHAVSSCIWFVLVFMWECCLHPCTSPMLWTQSHWRYRLHQGTCASPTFWNCCSKLEHSLLCLELSGTRGSTNTTVNHRGEGYGDGEGQNNNKPFATGVKVRMRVKMKMKKTRRGRRREWRGQQGRGEIEINPKGWARAWTKVIGH